MSVRREARAHRLQAMHAMRGMMHAMMRTMRVHMTRVSAMRVCVTKVRES